MINDRLEQFERKCKQIYNRQFDDFHELETAYCKLINEGTEIRKFVKENSLCDENSLKFLTNQTTNISMLDEKFKPLLNILELKKRLLAHYNNYIGYLLKNQRFHEAVAIYGQMFKFSGNYFYKKEIANIYLKIFGDFETCFKIYKDTEPHLKNEPYFWWEFSEVYLHKGDFFNQLLCMQNAINIEMERINARIFGRNTGL